MSRKAPGQQRKRQTARAVPLNPWLRMISSPFQLAGSVAVTSRRYLDDNAAMLTCAEAGELRTAD